MMGPLTGPGSRCGCELGFAVTEVLQALRRWREVMGVDGRPPAWKDQLGTEKGGKVPGRGRACAKGTEAGGRGYV